jgi:hypothetical protein
MMEVVRAGIELVEIDGAILVRSPQASAQIGEDRPGGGNPSRENR